MTEACIVSVPEVAVVGRKFWVISARRLSLALPIFCLHNGSIVSYWLSSRKLRVCEESALTFFIYLDKQEISWSDEFERGCLQFCGHPVLACAILSGAHNKEHTRVCKVSQDRVRWNGMSLWTSFSRANVLIRV